MYQNALGGVKRKKKKNKPVGFLVEPGGFWYTLGGERNRRRKMSQASYLNGYDDGYEDAVKELAKQGGPDGSGGSEDDPGACHIFTVHETVDAGGNLQISPATQADLFSGSDLDDFADIHIEFDGSRFVVTEPSGGFKLGDIIALSVNSKATEIVLSDASGDHLCYIEPSLGGDVHLMYVNGFLWFVPFAYSH